MAIYFFQRRHINPKLNRRDVDDYLKAVILTDEKVHETAKVKITLHNLINYFYYYRPE